MRVDQLEHASKLAERRKRAQEMLAMIQERPDDTEVATLYMNEYHKIYVPASLLAVLLEHMIAGLAVEMHGLGIRF